MLKDEGSAYRLDSITLPDLSILASGTVLDIRGKASVPESERAGASETPDGAIVLEDWGITTPYVPAGERTGANAPIDHTYLNLGYTVRQIYTGSTKLPVATPEVKTSYARLAGSVTLKGAVAPSIISFAQKIDPLYTVNVGERVTTEQFTLASSTDATLASLGLTYGLTMRLYHHSKTDPVDAPPVASSSPFSWDRKSVSRHQVSWRRPFSIDAITLVPSVTATLDPLPFSLVPKLEFIRGRLSASASYRFADDGSGALVGDDAVFRLSYLDKGRIEFASSATYRGDVARTAADFWSPVLLGSSLSIHPFGSFLSLSQSFSYDFEESRFERFSLSAGCHGRRQASRAAPRPRKWCSICSIPRCASRRSSVVGGRTGLPSRWTSMPPIGIPSGIRLHRVSPSGSTVRSRSPSSFRSMWR